MEHGEFRLYETQAILRYAERWAPGPALIPADARAAARMNQIVGIVDWYVFPSITVGITAERLMSQVFWGRRPMRANIAKAMPVARTCIRELGALEGSGGILAGSTAVHRGSHVGAATGVFSRDSGRSRAFERHFARRLADTNDDACEHAGHPVGATQTNRMMIRRTI